MSTSLLLILFAALAVFSGLLQGLVAAIEIRKHTAKPGDPIKWLTIISICAILAIISSITSYVVSPSSNAPPTATPSVGTNPTPTAIATLQPTATSTTPAETPTVLPTPTLTTATQLKTSLPIVLGCQCDDPIIVTITKITIQPELRRMVWSITLQNVSQSAPYIYFSFFHLEEGDQIHHPTGPGENIYDPTGHYLNGDGKNIQPGTEFLTFIFTFMPLSEPYTVASKIGGDAKVDFDPVIVEFQ